MRLWFRTPARTSQAGQPLPTPAKTGRPTRARLRLEEIEDRTATSAVTAGPDPDWDVPPALIGDSQPGDPVDSPDLPKPVADLPADAIVGKPSGPAGKAGPTADQVPPAVPPGGSRIPTFGARFDFEQDQVESPPSRPEKARGDERTDTPAARTETEAKSAGPVSGELVSGRTDRASRPGDKASAPSVPTAASTVVATATMVRQATRSAGIVAGVRSATADGLAAPAKVGAASTGQVVATVAASRIQTDAFHADLTDGTLLQRFVTDREQAAFTALVQRHAGFVLGVCHRVLGDFHAAQDAVQATFLVLARKAGMLDRSGPLGGWLYKVAYHLALRSRGVAARQKQTERAADPADTTETPAPDLDLELEEVRQAIREELEHLPEKYRAPLMLCYFDGRTHADVAREIGVPRGSMAKRIGEGLECLRERLLDRGLTF